MDVLRTLTFCSVLVGLGTTYALTTRIERVPASSLLARKEEAARRSFPNSQHLVDLFELRVPRVLLKTSEKVGVDEVAASFGHSPIFALERYLIGQTKLAQNTSVPAAFDKGDRMAIWTVDEKTEDELLLEWHAAGAPFSGATYLSVKDDGSAKVLSFGSALNVPNGQSDKVANSLHFHYFYSRILLVNTAITLIIRSFFS